MIKSIPDRTLTLIFTKSVSLQDWHRAGILERECKQYLRLASDGWRVNFVTYGDGSDLEFTEMLAPIKILCNRWGIDPEQYQALIPCLFSETIQQTDLIKIHQIEGGEAALRCCEVWKKPLLVRCGYLASHTGSERVDIGRISESELGEIIDLEKRLFKFGSEIIVTTRAIRDHIVREYAVAEEKVSIIPNSVDTELFSPKPDEPKTNKVVFVGRLSAEKNLSNLVLACHELGLPLEMIGDGPAQQELKDLSVALGSEVIFQGALAHEELPEHLRASKIFALVSLYEGNPKALLEAMSCGMAVLGTNVKGIRDLIEDGVNGILCNTDAESIRKGLARILTDRELSEKISKNARMDIVQNNSFEKVFSEEKSVLERLVGNAGLKKGRGAVIKARLMGICCRSVSPVVSKLKKRIAKVFHA